MSDMSAPVGSTTHPRLARSLPSSESWGEFRDELTAELEGGQAQLAQFAKQHEALQAEIDQIDVEGIVLSELTAIRSLIVGDAQASSREGVDAFRVALRRLFDHFELIEWPGFGGPPSQATDSIIYQGQAPVVERGGHSLVLLPHVRREAVDWEGDQTEFPALRRVALSLRASLSARLAA
jgi:hypothetical protein